MVWFRVTVLSETPSTPSPFKKTASAPDTSQNIVVLLPRGMLVLVAPKSWMIGKSHGVGENVGVTVGLTTLMWLISWTAPPGFSARRT